MNQSISPCKEVNFLPLRQSWPLWKIVSIRAAAGDAMGFAQLVKNIIHFLGQTSNTICFKKQMRENSRMTLPFSLQEKPCFAISSISL